MLDPSVDAAESVLPRQPTLDEPVLTTIVRLPFAPLSWSSDGRKWRDVRRVLTKLFHVLVPRTFTRASKGVEALRDCALPFHPTIQPGALCAYLRFHSFI